MWVWTNEWLVKYSGFTSFNHIILNDTEDKLYWKDLDGKLLNVVVSHVWNAIHLRSNEVDWFDVVWFFQSIPLHAFLVWLLIGERLKTQDKIQAWEADSSANLEECVVLYVNLCKILTLTYFLISYFCSSFGWRLKLLFIY